MVSVALAAPGENKNKRSLGRGYDPAFAGLRIDRECRVVGYRFGRLRTQTCPPPAGTRVYVGARANGRPGSPKLRSPPSYAGNQSLDAALEAGQRRIDVSILPKRLDLIRARRSTRSNQ